MSNLTDYDGAGWHEGSPRFREFNEKFPQQVHNYSWVLKKIWREFFSHPIGFAKLYMRKIWHFLNNYEIPSNNNYYLHQYFSYILRSPLNNFSFVIALAFIGIISSVKFRHTLSLAYIFAASLSLSVLLFYNVARFRLPVVPFFILFSGWGAYTLTQTLLQKKIPLFFTGLLVVVSIIYILENKQNAKIRIVDYGMLAEVFEKQGRITEAVKTLQMAVKQYPNSSHSYRKLGDLHLKRGHLPRAAKLYHKALYLDADNKTVLNNLGLVYLNQGKLDKGISYLKRIVAQSPNNRNALYNLALAFHLKNNTQAAQRYCRNLNKLGYKCPPQLLKKEQKQKPLTTLK
jgi:tetratricopeptide (TPR) repeat protein